MIWKPIAALLICLGIGLVAARAQLLQTGVGRGSATGISGPYFQLVCPSGGTVGVPSTNFTLTGFNGAVFNGTTNTVTMTDGSTGTFTPTSPATPAAGGTFSFTYTPPATPATYTITVSTAVATVIGSPCPYNASGAVTQNPLPLVIP